MDSEESDYEGIKMDKVSFVRSLKIEDDKLTQNLMRYFTKEIKNRPNINILTHADILIPED